MVIQTMKIVQSTNLGQAFQNARFANSAPILTVVAQLFERVHGIGCRGAPVAHRERGVCQTQPCEYPRSMHAPSPTLQCRASYAGSQVKQNVRRQICHASRELTLFLEYIWHYRSADPTSCPDFDASCQKAERGSTPIIRPPWFTRAWTLHLLCDRNIVQTATNREIELPACMSAFANPQVARLTFVLSITTLLEASPNLSTKEPNALPKHPFGSRAEEMRRPCQRMYQMGRQGSGSSVNPFRVCGRLTLPQ